MINYLKNRLVFKRHAELVEVKLKKLSLNFSVELRQIQPVEMLSKFLLLVTLVLTNSGFSQDSYESDKYNLKVAFPNFYEEEESDKEGRHVVSLSSTYNDMILLASLFIYNENIPEDEYNLKEIEALLITADAFNSKFKVKKIKRWKVGQYEGLRNPIKGKVKTDNGSTISFYGCMYVLIYDDNKELRLTILSQNKKSYLEDIEKAFAGSVVVE